MLKYQYDAEALQMEELPNDGDTEFRIRIKREGPLLVGMKSVQAYFEENRVHTDVMFYIYGNHTYHIIVRRDCYDDFLLQLLKHHLIESLAWV